jgi:uncharacterized membrane protein YphA (DoxX/SURF4 family)
MGNSQHAMALAGRVLIAMIFLASAFGKITNFDETTRFMAAHGVPAAAFFCVAAAAVEILGGISLVLGFYAAWGSAALAGYLLPVTAAFHLGPEQRIQLLKNLAILGGLLQLAAFGPGRYSLDHKAP